MHRNDQLRAREAKRGVFSRTAVPSGDEPEAEAATEEDRALAAMFAGDDDGLTPDAREDARGEQS